MKFQDIVREFADIMLTNHRTPLDFSVGGPRPRVGGGWEPKKDSREKLAKIFQEEIKNKKLIKVDPQSMGPAFSIGT